MSKDKQIKEKGYIQKARAKFNNAMQRYGNKLYDGLGDILITNINKQELLALYASTFILSVSGCALKNNLKSEPAPMPPEIQVMEHGIDVNEKKLGGMISESLEIKSADTIRFNDISDKIEKQLEKETRKDLVVGLTISGLLDNLYIHKSDKKWDINATDSVYSSKEIKETLNKYNIKYINTRINKSRANLYFIMTKEGQKLLQEKLEEGYPNRHIKIRKEVEDKMDNLRKKKQAEVEDKIRGSDKLFVYLEGNLESMAGPFTKSYDWYSEEIKVNKKVLSKFFQEKGYTEFYVVKNEEYLKTLLGKINKVSDGDDTLVIFYNGHGVKKGLSIEFSNILEPKEIEEDLKGYKGNAILFASCCFSGNFKDYFKNNKSNITVISASKNGDILRANEYGRPGLLAEDILKSDMDLKNFNKYFKNNRKRKYYPEIYTPSNK